MQPADHQQEHNRLSNLYREMADDELENVAAEAYDLTDIAKECLRFEISSRGLKIQLNLTAPPSDDEPEPLPPSDDGFVPDDEDLAPIHTAHGMDGLLKVRSLLALGGFECFLGDAKLRDPAALRETFENGVEMYVWKEQTQRALSYLAYNMPSEGSDEPDLPPAEIRCPKCKSDGVVFEERDVESTGGKLVRASKFRWVCDDCGHEWEDEGIVAEAPPE